MINNSNSMIRTSGMPSRQLQNSNTGNTGGKVSVADLQRITALLG